MEHYMCQKSYIPKTRAEQISDSLDYPPKKFNMPQMSFSKIRKRTQGSIEEPSQYIQKSKPSSSTSEGASQGGRPKETPIY